MGDEHHRRAQRLPELQQIVVELEAGDLVERGERLVHQQQLRLGDERARDRDAHAHAAGQFARIGVGELCQADAAERRLDALGAALPRRRAVQLERQQHVVEHVAHGISVGSWNTKPIRLSAGVARRRRPFDRACASARSGRR